MVDVDRETVVTEKNPDRESRLRALCTGPAVVAVLTWLAATALFLFVEGRYNKLDPLTPRGAFIPLAIGAALLAGCAAVAVVRRRSGDRLVAVGAGLFAAWVALALRSALNLTPFGFGGLGADMGRMTAAVNRYTVTPWPSDTFIDGLPSEYPPLYPWLLGRIALLLDVPAWRLLGAAEVLLTSAAVLAAFLLWRRIVPAGAALVISASGLLVFGDPRKAFAIITLLVFLPWLLATFTETGKGRLHWLPAGLIGGLIMVTYNGWFPFGVVGVFAILVTAWRRSENRGAYVRHVLAVGLITTLMALPYMVPYLSAVLTKGGQGLGDLYQSFEITENGFPFLDPTLLGGLQLVGLIGLVWYRAKPWAWPMLWLVLGSYVFWLVMGLRYLLTDHTTLIHYVPRLTGVTLAAAGVLTLTSVVPVLIRRVGAVPPSRTGVAVLAVAMLWIGTTYWSAWRPVTAFGKTEADRTFGVLATFAHLEPLPDCSPVRTLPKGVRLDDFRPGCVPAVRVKEEVESVLGKGARPTILSADERLFAYLPWNAYMGTDRTSSSSLSRWDDRYAEVKRLMTITDPSELTRASAATEFGPIDAFMLFKGPDYWQAIDGGFVRERFDTQDWIIEDVSQYFVLVIRKP
ncbi:Arabinofuranosyltransferase A C terminal [Actinokineospora alba]|uniref:Arabinofuranosyltransferase A C terminal n=2 Tax=Actinokineospora alba TaxID=504798 RepID=A0A1H0TBL5_9PSEU|nr:arabinofuranosyltransferase-like protein [Actinokineospora alba]SDJ20696.1 Arabinofuranosyltransferase A C terminal [Actinokineospora alba]SDP51080.1 Arabinofuranosyltransferase A C terminal [Actinokineospora alba]